MGKKLWQYQLVEYKGQICCLTRLEFGQNSSPKIKTAVLKTVLTKDDAVKRATCSYIEHVNRYWPTGKPPESLENGMSLGLKLQ